MASYVYSVANDFPDGAVNPTKLDSEIRASSIVTALDGIVVVGDVLTIYFKAALSAPDKTTLDGNTTNPAGGLIAATDNTPSNPITKVDIQQEEQISSAFVGTRDFFQTTTVQFLATAGTTTNYVFSFKYPISVLSTNLTIAEEHYGDTMNIKANIPVPLGVLTATASPGDSTFNVPNFAARNVYAGDAMRLVNGTTMQTFPLVINSDPVANTLTVDGTASTTFPAGSTQVFGTVYTWRDVKLGPEANHTFGRSKIGSSFVPANFPLTVEYVNRTPIETVALLTQSATAGDNVFEIDSGISTLRFGDQVRLSDGTNADALGTITQISRTNSTITTSATAANSFAVGTPIQKTAKQVYGYMEYFR